MKLWVKQLHSQTYHLDLTRYLLPVGADRKYQPTYICMCVLGSWSSPRNLEVITKIGQSVIQI